MTHNQSSAEQVEAAFPAEATGSAVRADQADSDTVQDGQADEAPPFEADDSTAPGAALLTLEEQNSMRSRWRSIQERFVDDPELAVESADELVGEAIQRLSELFRSTRQSLEEGWGKDDDSSSTEELRQALRRYRTFFDRILVV